MDTVMEENPQATTTTLYRGTSRRSQHKRDYQSHNVLQAQSLVGIDATVHSKKPRLKSSVLKATTAPPSDNPGHVDVTSGKASSCPLLQGGRMVSGGCPEESAPLTPRILALPPAAAAPTASKSSPNTSPATVTPTAATSSDTAVAPQSQSSASHPTPANSGGATEASASCLPVSLSQDVASELSFLQLPQISTPPAVHAAFAAAKKAATAAQAPPGVSSATAAISLMDLTEMSRTPVTTSAAMPVVGTCRSSASTSSSRRGRKPATVSVSGSKSRATPGDARAGGYQGRFCGRLYLKEDEGKLATECQLLGSLLGCVTESGARAGDPGRHTLAKIVRGFASGTVREHCQKRERRIKELETALLAQKAASAKSESALRAQVQAMRTHMQQLPAATRPGAPHWQSDMTSKLGQPQAAFAAASAAAAQAQAAAKTALATISALSSVAPPSAALQRALRCKRSLPPPPRFSDAVAAANSLHDSLALTSTALSCVAPAVLPQSVVDGDRGVCTPLVVTAPVPSLSEPSLLPRESVTCVPAISSSHSARGRHENHMCHRGGPIQAFGAKLNVTADDNNKDLARLSMESVADSCGSPSNITCLGVPPVTVMDIRHGRNPILEWATLRQSPTSISAISDHSADRQAVIAAAQQAFQGFTQQQQQSVVPPSHHGVMLPSSHRSAFQPVSQRAPPAGATRPVPYRPLPPPAVFLAS